MQGFDKTMFEIYREAEFNRRYCVIYFTELGNHDRDDEIPKALMGDNLFDGFLSGWRKDEAKFKIEEILERLNKGETVTRDEIESTLKPYLEH